MGRLTVRLTLNIVALLAIWSCANKPVQKDLSLNTTGPLKRSQNSGCFSAAESAVSVNHGFFEVCYDPDYRLARYVKHTVKKENLESAGAERRNKFIADKKIIEMRLPYVKPDEYRRSGYDKGHLAPAADFAHSQQGMDISFVMSNMAPQLKNLNRKAWLKLETQVRQWACGEGQLTVITGPVLKAGLKKLRSGLVVPEEFFKVIIDETKPKKALAFLYSQKDGAETEYSQRVISFAELEKKISHNFSEHFSSDERSIFTQAAAPQQWKSCR